MRYHDIERLKEAAARYRADACSLSDVEELTDYAIDKLDEPARMPIQTDPLRIDNGDGTETWYGLPVVVTVGMVPECETPVEVRSRSLFKKSERAISGAGHVALVCRDEHCPGELRILLAPKPEPITWTPPASLPDGEWRWRDDTLIASCGQFFNVSIKKLVGKDFVKPPKNGLYRNVNGTATWIGE